MQKYNYLTLLLTALVLSACGGGDGDDTSVTTSNSPISEAVACTADDCVLISGKKYNLNDSYKDKKISHILSYNNGSKRIVLTGSDEPPSPKISGETTPAREWKREQYQVTNGVAVLLDDLDKLSIPSLSIDADKEVTVGHVYQPDIRIAKNKKTFKEQRLTVIQIQKENGKAIEKNDRVVYEHFVTRFNFLPHNKISGDLIELNQDGLTGKCVAESSFYNPGGGMLGDDEPHIPIVRYGCIVNVKYEGENYFTPVIAENAPHTHKDGIDVCNDADSNQYKYLCAKLDRNAIDSIVKQIEDNFAGIKKESKGIYSKRAILLIKPSLHDYHRKDLPKNKKRDLQKELGDIGNARDEYLEANPSKFSSTI